MNRIIETVIGSVIEWGGIEAVTCMDFLSQDTFDPYFFISLDIYYADTVPEFEQRSLTFPDAVAFESSRAHLKDRFLLKDIPVVGQNGRDPGAHGIALDQGSMAHSHSRHVGDGVPFPGAQDPELDSVVAEALLAMHGERK